MVFPPVGSEAADFEAIIGGDRLVTMLQLRDCRELILSLSDWTKFFTADKETNEMSILSLDVTRTPLFELLAIPDCIKDLDILTTVGRLDENLFVDGRGEKPKNKSCNPISNLLGYHGGGMYAAVVKSLQGDSFKTSAGLTSDLDTSRNSMLYCNMATSKFFVDFHVAFGASATFVFVVTGEVQLYLVEPTPKNVALFQSWKNEPGVFFGDVVGEYATFDISEGSFFFIPSSYIFGMFWPRNAITLGTNFLSLKTMKNHLNANIAEINQGVPRGLLYPGFMEILTQSLKYCASAGQPRLSNGTGGNIQARYPDDTSQQQQIKTIYFIVRNIFKELKDLNVKLPKWIRWITKTVIDCGVLAHLKGEVEEGIESDDLIHSFVKSFISYVQVGIDASVKLIPSTSSLSLNELFNSVYPSSSNLNSFADVTRQQEKRQQTPNELISKLIRVNEVEASSVATCHRCSKKRLKIIPCPKCTQSFCKKCALKLINDLGFEAFKDHCPSCSKQCCCFQKECPHGCTRSHHCFRFSKTAEPNPQVKKQQPKSSTTSSELQEGPAPIHPPLRKQDSDNEEESKYKCGLCRLYGHNRTTCPLMMSIRLPSSASTISKKNKVFLSVPPSHSSLSNYRCSNCKAMGHNKSTCPETV